jgi:hypothetical protein
MELKITLDISHEKTWSEICGGNIKVVINSHLYKLKQDLAKYCNAEFKEQWYVADDSDCSKCVYNINNENDWFEGCKGDKAVLEECALIGESVTVSKIADWVWHKNCPRYRPCEKYIDNISMVEFKKLKEILS